MVLKGGASRERTAVPATKTKKLRLSITHSVVTSLSILDVKTPLVLYIAKYVFPKI